MARSIEAACREELRRAGLPGQGPLLRLLVLLRVAPETHLALGEVAAMAAASGIAGSPAGLARQLETLVEHGLLRRLPSIAAEPVFDTVAEPHSHIVYEETGQTIDLAVSPETLLAMLRQTLAERPDGVEIMIRVRRGPGQAASPAPRRGAGGRAEARA